MSGGTITAFPNGSRDQARAIAIQADGKIIVAGTSTAPVENGDDNFAIVRYNPDGILDPTFGMNGATITAFPNGSADRAFAVAIQADGKIVVAGASTAPVENGDLNFALVRYNPDGILDPTFGVNGGTLTDIRGHSGDSASAVALQAEGKIVAAEVSNAPVESGDVNFALIRYNPDGTVDTTFGNSALNPGRVRTDFGNHSADRADAIVIQADGLIVAAGSSTAPIANGDLNFALIRYDINGIPITNFGTNNRVLTDFGNRSSDKVFAVALQADGKIVAAGVSNAPISNGDVNFALVRYLP